MTDREWRAAFWRREGVPYVAIARDYGLQCLRSKAHKMGFRRLARRGSSPYQEGPCVECGVVHDRGEIDAQYRCPECVVETVPTDLEFERREHRGRMEDAARKRRLRRPYTMLPGPFSEKPERVNRRGEAHG